MKSSWSIWCQFDVSPRLCRKFNKISDVITSRKSFFPFSFIQQAGNQKFFEGNNIHMVCGINLAPSRKPSRGCCRDPIFPTARSEKQRQIKQRYQSFFFSLLPHWHTNAQTHFKSQSTKGNQISKFPRQFPPLLPLSHFSPSTFLINIQAPYNFFHFLFPFSISTCLAFICPLPQAELFQRSWIFHLSLLPSYHLNTNKFMMIFTSILPLQIAHGSHRGAAVAPVR